MSESLFDRLAAAGRDGRTRLHLPAHGGGAGNPLLEPLGPWAALDLTELPGLDDWAMPRGILRDAGQRAADAYHLDGAHILTGGSTQGLTTALIAALGPGDGVLLHRGVHRSVLAGLVATGARPHFVEDTWDDAFGVGWPDIEAMATRMETLRPRAVLVTYPTYQGIAPDLSPLVEARERTQSLLIVDSAHGAHFGWGPTPPPAASFHPDLVVLGMHKSGGSLTPSALLGWCGGRLDTTRLEAARRLAGTSSPSYPLMASVDLAVRNLATRGSDLVSKTAGAMEALEGPAVFRPADVPMDPTRMDPTRAVVAQAGRHPVEEVLRSSGVEPEYASADHVLLYAPLGLEVLPGPVIDAVRSLPPPKAGPGAPSLPECRMSPREAFFARSVSVPLERAAGRVASGLVFFSPPGVLLLWPGEVITETILADLRRLSARSSPVGLGPDGVTIAVVAD